MKVSPTTMGWVPPCPKSPPDGIEPELWAALTEPVREGWQSLTDEDRRHVTAAVRAQIDTTRPREKSYAERVAEIDAKADPATQDALARLIAAKAAGCPPNVDPLTGEVIADVAISLSSLSEEYQKEESRHARCGIPLVGQSNGRWVFSWSRCKRKSCTVCAPGWQASKLAGLHVVADALVGGSFDDDPALSTGLVRDDEWEATRTRLRRHGCGWLTIPAEDGQRFVITDDADFGSPRPLDAVIAEATEALEAVSARVGETRQTRFSKGWREIVDASIIEPERADDIDWRGVATKAETPQKLAAKARRAGGIAAPVASRDDENPEASAMWAVTIRPDLEWKLLNLVGFKDFAQLAEERASRRQHREYLEWERRQWRQKVAA